MFVIIFISLILLGTGVWIVISKKKGKKPIQQIPIKENDEIRTITVHLDTKKIMKDIEKARRRREQLSENPPASLPEGSIETIEVKEAFSLFSWI
jgi:hypothetical protein